MWDHRWRKLQELEVGWSEGSGGWGRSKKEKRDGRRETRK